jgi:transcription termination/antitermination protein NusG
MSTQIQSWELPLPVQVPALESRSWYALLTQARHEKMVAHRLQERGISAFLPLVTEVRQWRRRKRKVELPLFSCYVFAKLLPTNEDRLRSLRIDGVFSLVGPKGVGTPIPDDQIEAVQRLVEGNLPWGSHPFLKIGQRVRIRSGALDGLEGILVSRSGESTLIVSIDAIQRSLAVRIEGYDVEPV